MISFLQLKYTDWLNEIKTKIHVYCLYETNISSKDRHWLAVKEWMKVWKSNRMSKHTVNTKLIPNEKQSEVTVIESPVYILLLLVNW